MYALISQQVVIVDILEEVGKKTAEELCSHYGNRAVFFNCNVTNKKDCEGKYILFNRYSIHSHFMCCFNIFQHI